MVDLVGVWQLISYCVTDEHGQVAEPFGPRPVGTGIYAATGIVSALLMRPDRTGWGHALPAGHPDADHARVVDAAAGFIGYTGTYEIDVQRAVVRHHVTCSLAPDWVGTVLERHYQLAGDVLVLTTAPRAGRTAQLRWRRQGP